MELRTFRIIASLSAVILGTIVFFLFSYDCEKYLKTIKKQEWSYRIDSIYTDNKNRAAQTLLVSNVNGVKNKLTPHEFPELYNSASTGDSIYKASGSLKVLLIKGNDTPITFHAYCDGEVIN